MTEMTKMIERMTKNDRKSFNNIRQCCKMTKTCEGKTTDHLTMSKNVKK